MISIEQLAGPLTKLFNLLRTYAQLPSIAVKPVAEELHFLAAAYTTFLLIDVQFKSLSQVLTDAGEHALGSDGRLGEYQEVIRVTNELQSASL